jgi:hypothetical protein
MQRVEPIQCASTPLGGANYLQQVRITRLPAQKSTMKRNMPIRRLIPLTAAMLTASVFAAHAGSCSNDIDLMQARIDARVEAIAAAGSFVPPGISAGMGVQPTPFGMATVEEKMGEVSGNKVDAVHAAMARARAANAGANTAANYRACEKALAEVRHIMAR